METGHLVDQFRSQGYAELSLSRGFGDAQLGLAREFFDRPLAQRFALGAFNGTGVLGYYPSESDAVALRDDFGVSVPTFDGFRARGYSSYDFLVNADVLASCELFGPNRWPDNDSEFTTRARRAYEELSALSKRVSLSALGALTARGASAALSARVFDSECCSLMRLLSYEAGAQPRMSKAHTDYEFVSIIISSAGGLEVKSPSSQWKQAPYGSNVAIILPGDMLEAASKGYVRSSLHRVRTTSEDRLSVIFFQGLPLDEPIPYPGEVQDMTFRKHICAMLIRGAAHLQSRIPHWEKELKITIPARNPFRAGKDEV